ncbi:MAG TPA: hypothetical protein VNL16_10465 [Chloroflexota bacterium]|nr:hypothetical protein [Chloroflexota bacterium]
MARRPEAAAGLVKRADDRRASPARPAWRAARAVVGGLACHESRWYDRSRRRHAAAIRGAGPRLSQPDRDSTIALPLAALDPLVAP